MPTDGSVTHWLGQLQAGDPAAPQQLWERYFRRLVALARAKLRDSPGLAGDEEDLALSAFNSFFEGAGDGRFPQLNDRDNLWRLLMVITARKACNLKRDGRRQKRGGAVVKAPAAAGRPDEVDLEQVVGREPTPEFAAQVAEECQRLLDLLGDNDLRALALRKMEGYTNKEIAAALNRTPRTIERKLGLIRAIWQKEGTS